MISHAQGAGAGTRVGSVRVDIPIQVDHTDTVAREVLTVEASTQKPVALTMRMIGEVSFDGVPTVSLGTTTTANEILNAATPPAINVTSVPTASRIFTSRTKLFVKSAGGTTAGRVHLVLQFVELNRSKTEK